MTAIPRLPLWLRRAGGRARAEFVEQEVNTELHRLARAGRPILAGPWLGEVGFEVLYWIPFLRWALAEFNVDPTRVVAISRGGAAAWYRDIAVRYVDVFDTIALDDYRLANEQRRREVGEQKQIRLAAFDRDILSRVRRAEALEDADVLHPSLMYRLFQPYWWKHAALDWMMRHQRHVTMVAPALPDGLDLEAGEYIAVKFYFNDCFENSDAVRQLARQSLDALTSIAPVVSLSTVIAFDDHAGAHDDTTGRVRSIASWVGPGNNLAVQTAVLANARAFVGTYGGFSYLGPLHGVPTLALHANASGFDRAHLTLARSVFAQISAPSFEVIGSDQWSASVLANTVAKWIA